MIIPIIIISLLLVVLPVVINRRINTMLNNVKKENTEGWVVFANSRYRVNYLKPIIMFLAIFIVIVSFIFKGI